MSAALAAARAQRGPIQPVAWLALALAGLGLGGLAWGFGPRHAGLLVIGLLLGLVLYHAAFGFTGAWRRLINEHRGRGVRAQLVMLALAIVLFFPALDNLGTSVQGFVAPAGTAVIVGAFLFGAGMQLGGGCASGTLYTAGAGNTRMLVTLAAFIAGSGLATHHVHWWWQQPALAPVSLVDTLGPGGGIALCLAALAALYAATAVLEKQQHGTLEQPATSGRHGLQRLLRGPWPLLAGGVALAVLNFATLITAGHPWGITAAFALWGAKILQALGMTVTEWPYWQMAGHAADLEASVLADSTSVMNIGIVLGALLAAGLAGRFRLGGRLPLRPLLAAVVGGLLLGYGARLAFGCNIGAYFSGVASGSLHGWLWLVFGFLGNIAGTGLRP